MPRKQWSFYGSNSKGNSYAALNAKDKLGATDRTQLPVMALLYRLIDPLG